MHPDPSPRLHLRGEDVHQSGNDFQILLQFRDFVRYGNGMALLNHDAFADADELNRISWNEQEPKYDIRRWAPDHEKMGKGITLSDDELLKLAVLLAEE